MISPNVVVIWPGTNAAIPTGFTRETTLDDLYPKGTANGTNPNTTGGTATHTHTSTAHTHTIDAHTHTYTLDRTYIAGVGSGSGGDNQTLDGNHYHNGTSGAASASTSGSTAVTYAAFSSEPPYYKVIYIKATGYRLVPDDTIVLWDKSTAAPSGYVYCDGGGGTPDLRGKYLKGAATGGDGGAGSGSVTNNHTIAHAHTGVSHTHAATTTGTPLDNGWCADNTNSNPVLIYAWHTHSVPMSAGTQNLTDYGGSIGNQAETVEPAFTRMSALQNTSGNKLNCQPGMVAMWLGTLATIPYGWVLCDGTKGTTDMRSRHLKITDSLLDLATTGGANTHTHASQSHTHTANGTHTHTPTGTGHIGQTDLDGGGSSPHRADQETHGATVTAGTTGMSTNGTTADSSNNEPPYRTAAYIEFKFMQAGAGVLGLLN